MMFKRIALLAGVTLSPQAIQGLDNHQGNFVFVLPDIAKLDVKVSYLFLFLRIFQIYD